MQLLLLSALILLSGFEPADPAGVGSDAAIVPIVVALFAEGKELVIEPCLERLKELELTLDQLASLRGRRLTEDGVVTIDGKKIKLADVAKVTVRNLVAKPFAVALPDGREAVIVPDAKKVGRYLVTGEYNLQRVSAWTEQSVPFGRSPDSGRQARAVADADRALLCEFLIKRFRGASVADRNRLRTLLQETEADLRWTAKERQQMLGE
jgi:hypothetical protein